MIGIGTGLTNWRRQVVPLVYPATLFDGVPGGYYSLASGTVWQDTAGTAPATADGDPVARVDDQSGHANHLLQATSGERPLLKILSGGRRALRFDGTDDTLGTSGMAAFTGAWSRVMAFNRTHKVGTALWGGVSTITMVFHAGGTEQFICRAGNIALDVTIPELTDFVMIERYRGGGADEVYLNAVLMNTADAGSTKPIGLVVGGRGDADLTTPLDWFGGAMIQSTDDTILGQLNDDFAALAGITF